MLVWKAAQNGTKRVLVLTYGASRFVVSRRFVAIATLLRDVTTPNKCGATYHATPNVRGSNAVVSQISEAYKLLKICNLRSVCCQNRKRVYFKHLSLGLAHQHRPSRMEYAMRCVCTGIPSAALGAQLALRGYVWRPSLLAVKKHEV